MGVRKEDGWKWSDDARGEDCNNNDKAENNDTGNGSRDGSIAGVATSIVWPPNDGIAPSIEEAPQTAVGRAISQTSPLQNGTLDENTGCSTQLVDKLVQFLKQAKNADRGMAVIRSAASGVPSAAAEAAVARFFEESTNNKTSSESPHLEHSGKGCPLAPGQDI